MVTWPGVCNNSKSSIRKRGMPNATQRLTLSDGGVPASISLRVCASLAA
jgi:hypothetical protein